MSLDGITDGAESMTVLPYFSSVVPAIGSFGETPKSVTAPSVPYQTQR